MSKPIPCTLQIDAAALASLAPSATTHGLADTLARVESLLKDCRERIDAGSKLLLTGDEAAARLGISRRTLQELPIQSVLIGTARRWHVADLLAFIDANKTGGSQE